MSTEQFNNQSTSERDKEKESHLQPEPRSSQKLRNSHLCASVHFASIQVNMNMVQHDKKWLPQNVSTMKSFLRFCVSFETKVCENSLSASFFTPESHTNIKNLAETNKKRVLKKSILCHFHFLDSGNSGHFDRKMMPLRLQRGPLQSDLGSEICRKPAEKSGLKHCFVEM